MIVLRWTPADALHPIACLELVSIALLPGLSILSDIRIYSNPSETPATREPTSISLVKTFSSAPGAQSITVFSNSTNSMFPNTNTMKKSKMGTGITSLQIS